MIRKLRIKIVLVIVLVAAVMLGVIFGMSYTMTRQDLRAQSISMMQAIAANPFEPIPPGQSRQVRLPYFVLRTDAFGNLVAIGSTDYDLTDRSAPSPRPLPRPRRTSARSRPIICASAAWTAA